MNQTIRLDEQVLHLGVEAELALPGDRRRPARRWRGSAPSARRRRGSPRRPWRWSRASAPVSSTRRVTRDGPPRLTMMLASAVAMISRRRRWPFTASGNRSRRAAREVALQLAVEIGVVRHGARQERVVERELGVGEQHGVFRPGQALAPAHPLGERRVVGQELDAAVEAALRLQGLHRSAWRSRSRRRPPALGERERQGLQLVVAQDEGGDLVGHRRPGGRCGLAASRRPSRSGIIRAILMFTSTSEVFTPAELSMASVLRRTPARAASMRPRWVRPRLAPSPTTLARSSRPGDADGVVGPVAGLLVGLGGGADIGADAAEPEQVDRRLQDRLHQLGRASPRPGRSRAPRWISGESGMVLRLREKTPPPARDQAVVVVAPRTSGRGRTGAGARRSSRPRRGSGRGRCRGGRRPPRAAGSRDSSMPLPNTSPDMSPTPATVIGSRLDVDVDLAEMALHRLPGAAGGDAHALVVVALAAAGREGVAEPVAALQREGVGDVGEGGGALVGGDHEVGVVGIVPHRVGRRHDRVADDVVGEFEQRADEDPVALGALRPSRRRGRRPAAGAWGRSRPWRPPARSRRS